MVKQQKKLTSVSTISESVAAFLLEQNNNDWLGA